jgi:ABC-2 type transport system permease protein
MIHVFVKEFNGFLNSLIAYIVIGVFLTGMGLLMWIFPETSVLEYGYADMETLFTLGPFVLMFLIPAVTMKSFAEEKKMGTLEFLFTKPLTDWDIINGKFLAAWTLALFALLPTWVYYFSISQLGDPAGNIDTPGVIGSYVGLALLAGVYCSMGVFASSITPNQIVAFIVAAFLCFIFYSGFDSLSAMIAQGDAALQVKQLGILYHYDSLSQGLIDSRSLVYFISVSLIMLFLTKTVLGSRQW